MKRYAAELIGTFVLVFGGGVFKKTPLQVSFDEINWTVSDTEQT